MTAMIAVYEVVGSTYWTGFFFYFSFFFFAFHLNRLQSPLQKATGTRMK